MFPLCLKSSLNLDFILSFHVFLVECSIRVTTLLCVLHLFVLKVVLTAFTCFEYCINYEKLGLVPLRQ